MNNHTEIQVNVLKSVAYDDNWASQHKNAHLNQLRNKSQAVDFIFWCIAILTSEQDPVQTDKKITAPKHMHVKSTF